MSTIDLNTIGLQYGTVTAAQADANRAKIQHAIDSSHAGDTISFGGSGTPTCYIGWVGTMKNQGVLIADGGNAHTWNLLGLKLMLQANSVPPPGSLTSGGKPWALSLLQLKNFVHANLNFYLDGNVAGQYTVHAQNRNGLYIHGVRAEACDFLTGTWQVDNIRGVVGVSTAGVVEETFHAQIFQGKGGHDLVVKMAQTQPPHAPKFATADQEASSGLVFQQYQKSSPNPVPSKVKVFATRTRHGAGCYNGHGFTVSSGSVFTECGRALNFESGNSGSKPLVVGDTLGVVTITASIPGATALQFHHNGASFGGSPKITNLRTVGCDKAVEIIADTHYQSSYDFKGCQFTNVKKLCFNFAGPKGTVIPPLVNCVSSTWTSAKDGRGLPTAKLSNIGVPIKHPPT